jgi:hypothetical protein
MRHLHNFHKFCFVKHKANINKVNNVDKEIPNVKIIASSSNIKINIYSGEKLFDAYLSQCKK